MPDAGWLVIGLISGTSVDGVDAVLVRVHGSGTSLRVETVASHEEPMSHALRARVLDACMRDGGTSSNICQLNFEVGELFARAAGNVAKAAGIGLDRVDLIGSHGQTIYHIGMPEVGQTLSTMQIGEPSVIAERTGVTTVADFRVRDVAAGGQAAPLVPYLDWALFRSESRTRALQNIGGIGNVTVLPAGAASTGVYAFDTGPGNALIDATTAIATEGRQSLDDGGQLAAAGAVNVELQNYILSHPYLAVPPPKTTGRDMFGEQYAREVWKRGQQLGLQGTDIIATCTSATAKSIANAYHDWILPHNRIDEVFVSGGGARNPVLLRMLALELHGHKIALLEEIGGDANMKEAIAFAVFAAETVRGVPTSLPGVTGATHPSVLGKLVPGANWFAVQRRALAELSLLAGTTVES